MKRAIIVVVLLAVVGGGAGAWYSQRNKTEIQITTAPITRGDIVDTVGATGTLQAVTTVQVGSQVSGNIQWLGADFNSIVKKGQVIARLDPSIIQTQIEQAKANVTRGEADLEGRRVTLADAKRKLEQAKQMWEKQLIPREQLETADLNVKTQESAIRSAEAGLIQTRSQLNTQEVNLGHTVIRAPIDGIVISRSVDQGQTVAASMNAPVLYVIAADLTKMQIIANIDESEIGRMRTGQPVTFRVDAYPTDRFIGTVHQIRLLPTTVQNVVTYSTVISVPNPDYKLKPGMTGDVTIEIARRDNVLRAPAAALRFRPSNDVFAALKQEVPPEMARGGGMGGGRGPGGGRTGQGGPGGSAAAPAQTPAATPPAAAPASPTQAPAAAPQGQRRPEGQDATARPGGGDRTGDRPAGENRGGGRGNSNMTEEEREARRKQFEERMKNMTPEERAAMQQRGGGRGGFQRGGDTAAAGQGGRGSNPSAGMNRQGGGNRQGTGARDNQAQGESRLANTTATTVDALFAPLQPTEGRGRLWMFVDKKLKIVNVRTGISDGTWTEILEGGDASQLQPETQVVTNVVTGLEPAPRPGQQNPGGSPLMPQGQGRGGPGGGGGRGR